jgi:1,4-dihydroxy-2-naphthoate octaprenyltransferase
VPYASVFAGYTQVGSAAAYNQAGVFLATRYFGLLAAAVLVITLLNLR